MKSKPLTIAAAIIFAVITLVVLSNRDKDKNNNQLDKTEQEQRSASRTNEASESRSATRNNSSPSQPSEPIPKVWADQINNLLGDDAVTVEQAAVGMLKIADNGSSPLPARYGALEHALNLTQDKDFNNILSIIDPEKKELPADLAQAILDDTYNRSNVIQVTTALKILQAGYESIDAEENINEEAIELLEFHTDQKHGDDINAWEKAVADFIKEQNTIQDEAIQDEDAPEQLPDGDVPGEQ